MASFIISNDAWGFVIFTIILFITVKYIIPEPSINNKKEVGGKSIHES